MMLVGRTTGGALWYDTLSDGSYGQFQSLTGNDHMGDPSLGTTSNGLLTLSAQGKDGSYWVNSQTSRTAWGSWASLDMPQRNLTTATAGAPAAATNAIAGNNLYNTELFQVGSDGQVYHEYQQGTVSTWSGWSQIGSGVAFTHQIASAKGNDGFLYLFTRAADNTIWTNHQIPAANPTWSGWVQMSATAFAGNPIPVWRYDGTLDVYVLGADTSIYHAIQDPSQSSGFGGWAQLSGSTFASDPAVAIGHDGTVELAARGTQGSIWWNKQDPTNPANWLGWTALTGANAGYAGSLSLANMSGNYLMLAGRTSDGTVWINRQTSTGWTGFSALSGASYGGDPKLVADATGAVHFFGRDFGSTIWTNTWTGSGWSGFSSLFSGASGNPMAVNDHNGQLELFVEASAGGFLHSWLSGSTWATPQSM